MVRKITDLRYPPGPTPSQLDCSEGPPGPCEFEQRYRAWALAALGHQESDRRKLARLLHDEVSQILSAAGLQLDILRMDLADKVPEIAVRTGEIQELLDRVVKGVRDLSYQLNPDTVERAGVQLALDTMVGQFSKTFEGSLRLSYDSSARVPAAVGAAMQKIAEEAVANAIRHARCNEIEVIVESKRAGVALQVRDNGAGFDYWLAKRRANGFGLLTMEYYAAKAGLRLSVMKNDGGGMTVSAVAGAGQGSG